MEVFKQYGTIALIAYFGILLAELTIWLWKKSQKKYDFGKPLKFYYRNYRGVTEDRVVVPVDLWFGKTEFHTRPQWLLKAFDVNREQMRDFAVEDIIKFEHEQSYAQ